MGLELINHQLYGFIVDNHELSLMHLQRQNADEMKVTEQAIKQFQKLINFAHIQSGCTITELE